MSKVFRLYKEGPKTYQGWNESPAFPYNSNARDTIEDPDGASAKHEITSIPSPFARIDLVKTAFREVNKLATKDIKQLDGQTIFHKMVSDSLDVGEIFFNIDRFKDKVEIITWDPSRMIPEMMNDENVSHYYVGDALQKYLDSDSQTYNFGQMRNVYLLNYKEGPDELNIIGATSPATIFFSGANSLEYVHDIYFANNDKPFDAEYQPLYKREFDFIKAWWTLRKSIPNFTSLFPEIENYLNLTFRAITDNTIKQKLNTITSASSNDFSTIDVQAYQQTNEVEVLGTVLFKKKSVIDIRSEFEIKSERNFSGDIPLVLPVESGNKYAELMYVNGKWGRENKAPYIDSEVIEKRKLPFEGSVRPYLTISDFLEDTIIRVPHSLNTSKFFDGGLEEKETMTSFLIPIKPLYFRYFSVETLKSILEDGKPAFKMECVAGGSIRVALRIPITGNKSIKYIEYQRIYYAQHQAEISATENNGGVSTFTFAGFVMPSVKFPSDADAFYTVSCISTFSNQFRMEFYYGDELIRDIPMDCRNRERGLVDYKAETYTLNHQRFDFIKIVNQNGVGNAIVPDFLMHQDLDTYEFAVDLGTSNTHIEYKKANTPHTIPFTYGENEDMLSTFFIPSYTEVKGERLQRDLSDENDLIAADFIPAAVGAPGDFQFPTRTVLSCAKITNWDEDLRVFGLINFNLTYNKRTNLAYNDRPLVNIKWSREPNAQSAMKAFIKNTLMLIRNKVAANNGNIAKTKITWFFPNSMSEHRLGMLKKVWNESYRELFNVNGSTHFISESVAPIQYYFSRYATATNLVSVDIGGGTTDIAFANNREVNYITSFRLAANSLFEDSFSAINPNNGIVDWFKEDIRQLLSSRADNTKINELLTIFNSNVGMPANMASFLFSLKDNSATKGMAKNKIDFNLILQNDNKFKLVFIIFYTAIIYHIAKIVKSKNLKEPRHIAFSGNGSKIINIISTDSKLLADYTKLVFENVLGRKYDGALDILGFEDGSNPKESTCKGGLLNIEDVEAEPEEIVMKDSSGRMVTSSDTYESMDDVEKKRIVKSVEDFFKFVLSTMPSVFKFDHKFGVDPNTIGLALGVAKKDIATYLDKGIDLSIKESGNIKNEIEDALSFYPIKGVLQALSTKIQEYYINNPEK